MNVCVAYPPPSFPSTLEPHMPIRKRDEAVASQPSVDHPESDHDLLIRIASIVGAFGVPSASDSGPSGLGRIDRSGASVLVSAGAPPPPPPIASTIEVLSYRINDNTRLVNEIINVLGGGLGRKFDNPTGGECGYSLPFNDTLYGISDILNANNSRLLDILTALSAEFNFPPPDAVKSAR